MNSGLQQKHHKKVICLFCGTRTAVPVQTELRCEHPLEFDGHLSIIRCHLCGKEAVYRFEEIFDFQEGPQHNKSIAAGA